MFVNAYEFVVEDANGASIPVSLRLGAGGQLKLKKRWQEGTTETLFGAMDDIERFVDVCTTALTYKGNTNTIKDGETLIDLMAANGMLGMAEKQKIITSIACASGIFSEKEKTAIDERSEKVLDGMFDEDKNTGKNA